jgi:hypothetical protein
MPVEDEVELSGWESLGANKAHLSIGALTWAASATSMHDNSVDPKRGVWQVPSQQIYGEAN